MACGVSRRTIFRDLDVLRESGLPLRYDDTDERYDIGDTQFLPPTNFTPEEALSLIVLCHEMGSETGLPFFGPARAAAIKLEASLPPRLREQLHQTVDAVQIRPEPKNRLSGYDPVFEQIREAIVARHGVRILYKSLTEWEDIRTKLSPYRLLFSRRSWYVIGRSSLHRSTRTFNVGRILEIEPIKDDSFRVPRGFSIDRYLRNAWHLIPEPGPDSQVVVRFQKMVAQNVAEVTWHKTQQLKFRKDGTLDFHVTVSGLNEISWWILGYADQAHVIKPAKLRRMVAGRAQQTVEQYQPK